MELAETHLLNAPRQRVWEALNDPQILQQAIPGCESIERLPDFSMRAVVKTKIGPVSARFTGVVSFADVDAPTSYTIAFKGEGGTAGFAKGHARVELTDEGPVTSLRYKASAQVGGKLAQVGSRLVDSVAARTAADFFKRFTEIVEAREPLGGAEFPTAMSDPLPTALDTTATPTPPVAALKWCWAAIAAAAVVMALLWLVP